MKDIMFDGDLTLSQVEVALYDRPLSYWENPSSAAESHVELLPFDIFTAANLGETETIRNLLAADKSLDINQRNKSGWTALMYSAHIGLASLTEFLLMVGSDPSVRNFKGSTALMLAAGSGRTKVVQILARYRETLNLADNQGWTALFYACNCAHSACVQMLLEMGADPNCVENQQGTTAFMMVCREGHELCVQYFLNAVNLTTGVNMALKNHNGETARVLADMNGQTKIVGLLDTHVYQLVSAAKKADQSIVFPIKSSSAFTFTPKTPLASANVTPVQAIVHQSNDTDDRHRVASERARQFPQNLAELLDSLDLSKYQQIFDEHKIDMGTFLSLNEADLKDLGIKLMGPRKKMLNAIARIISNCPPVNINPLEQIYANYCKAQSDEQQKLYTKVLQELEAANAVLEKQQRSKEMIERAYGSLKASVDHCRRCVDKAQMQSQLLDSTLNGFRNGSTGMNIDQLLVTVEWHNKQVAESCNLCLAKLAEVK